jgi:putative intracellular protease/amidase
MSLIDPNPVNPRRRKRVAIVITNPARLTKSVWPVGCWWSEFTHPYQELTEAGYTIEILSMTGGA